MPIQIDDPHADGAHDDDPVALLAACHARIRRYGALAVRLAAARDAPAHEIAEAAEAVRRYFGEALPLHAADEDEILAPRLRGRDPAVDAALDTLHAEHDEHKAPLEVLHAMLSDLVLSPERLDVLRPALSALAARLNEAFERHLVHEEAVLFPALVRLLNAEERRAAVAEMRARRAAGGAAHVDLLDR